ncbi:MAG: hypothetical protein ACK40Z_15020, partial [Dietzia sp.]
MLAAEAQAQHDTECLHVAIVRCSNGCNRPFAAWFRLPGEAGAAGAAGAAGEVASSITAIPHPSAAYTAAAAAAAAEAAERAVTDGQESEEEEEPPPAARTRAGVLASPAALGRLLLCQCASHKCT